MNISFEKLSRRTSPIAGAIAGTDPAASGARNTGADSNLIRIADHLPPGRRNSERLSAAPLFIPADPPLERGQVTQTLFDIGAVAFGILFVCSVACSIPVALFLLFFAQF